MNGFQPRMAYLRGIWKLLETFWVITAVEVLLVPGEQRTAILLNILTYTERKGELSLSKNHPVQNVKVEKIWSV